ncbi:Uncharacterized protein APZ42_009108 [Daphnia magna]|uniref:Uncharacterized protein n=1 Tax=Daphnia magna TaxID=35525 RepID=A0A164E7N0_9CRUS|nr:Uncharacterized protein APZ42_009108 [Daphnia magna]
MLRGILLKEICSCGLYLDDSCIGNIFLLLGTKNIGCLDANEVSFERFRKT